MAKKSKGKKGGKKRGKKGGKKKRGGVKPVLPPPPPPPPPTPPPPTFAKIFEYTFANETSFMDSLKDLDFSIPTYILFWPAEERLCQVPKEGLPLEKALYIHFIRMQKTPLSRNIQFILVEVEKGKLSESPLHIHPEIHLNDVPSIMRWGCLRKIEGAEECYDPNLLSFFFEDEIGRNCRVIEETADRCPFLPPPRPPSPPPPTPPPKKPPKKKGKGKKAKGKGKKGKAKGKKGKKK